MVTYLTNCKKFQKSFAEKSIKSKEKFFDYSSANWEVIRDTFKINIEYLNLEDTAQNLLDNLIEKIEMVESTCIKERYRRPPKSPGKQWESFKINNLAKRKRSAFIAFKKYASKDRSASGERA